MQRVLFPLEAKLLNVSWLYSIGVKANRNAGRELLTVNRLTRSNGIKAVRIRRLFNLGNHLRQVANAIRFAEIHNINYVILPQGSVFHEGSVGQVKLLKSNNTRHRAWLELVGDFFYFEKLGIDSSDLHRSRIVKDLRVSIESSIDHSSNKADNALVIHLRGGDSFDAKPHPLYIPPPLAFFTDAIKLSKKKRVHVVFQSDFHPYISSIKNYCDNEGVVYTASSSTLPDDFATLMSADSLCISQGTLALAAGWLSSACEAIYCFERDSLEVQATCELGIKLIMAKSTKELGPWRGTDEEIAVLRNLTASELIWTEIS